MHEGQLDIGTETVARLVAEQFPGFAGLGVEPLAGSGTVNALFRLGERLAARFPLQPADPTTVRRDLEAEAAAAREMFGRTRFATPEPVAIGAPGHGYPLPWSIQTWVPGTAASTEPAADSAAFAEDLADFITGVRAIAVGDRRFVGSNRGGELTRHDAWVATCLDRSVGLIDVPRLRHLWSSLRTLPRLAPDTMNHGDLIPGNVLVADGRLTGVIDVGGLGPADPALDLVAAWHLLGSGPREILRRTLGVDDLDWARSQAWALEQALGAGWYYRHTNPVMHRMGVTTLRRILADPLDR